MGLLDGKKILVTGIANKYSIAYGIAQSLYKQNATLAFTYHTEKTRKKVLNIANEMGVKLVIPCDVTNDNSIKKLFFCIKKKWNKFDGFVHSIAHSSKKQLSGDYINNITRTDFSRVLDVSCYSFSGMAKECRNILKTNASLLTLSYIGSQRVIPNYNVMGIAKAALESNVKYMAYYMGPNGIRVNAISPSPLKTLSIYGIKNFKKLLNFTTMCSPNKNPITIQDVGNVAAFLSSDLSKGITGQIIYVDGGLHITAMNNFK
ncbi:MAG: enoyl-ACP reductase [Buchnera aphidicola (Chaetogeoica yunlongensis)]